jgi:uncharacterized protein YacL
VGAQIPSNVFAGSFCTLITVTTVDAVVFTILVLFIIYLLIFLSLLFYRYRYCYCYCFITIIINIYLQQLFLKYFIFKGQALISWLLNRVKSDTVPNTGVLK